VIPGTEYSWLLDKNCSVYCGPLIGIKISNRLDHPFKYGSNSLKAGEADDPISS
jgi:hypothetical protein